MAGANGGHNKIYRRKQFRSRSYRKKHNIHTNHNSTTANVQQLDQSVTPNTPGLPVPTSASTPRTLTFENLTITSGLGFELLRKAGWNPGQRLGLPSSHPVATVSPTTSATIVSPSDFSTSDSDPSLSVPLPIVIRDKRAGIGAIGNAFTTVSDPTTCPSSKNFNANKTNNYKRVHHHPRSRKNYGRHNKSRSNKHDDRNDTADDNSDDDQFGSPNDAYSYDLYGNHTMSGSPTSIVSHMAKLDIFDPLCPHCPYDSNHVVRDLKALRKHVKTCPANPDRVIPRPNSVSSDSVASSSEAAALAVSNPDLDALSCSSVGSPCNPSSDSMESDVDFATLLLQRSLSFCDDARAGTSQSANPLPVNHS